MSHRARRCALVLVGMLCTAPAFATPITIVSVTPTSQNTATLARLLGVEMEAWAVSWTQSDSYENVTVSAMVVSQSFQNPAPGSAFLTAQIGPGTTTAEQVASAPFLAPVGSAFSASFVPIFTGLTLGPGTYFLTLTGETSALLGEPLWRMDTPSTLVTAPGVTSHPEAWCVTDDHLAFSGCGIGIAPFIPASPFLDFNQAGNNYRLAFEVTGDPANVPEPTTAILAVWGLAPLVLRRRSAEH